MRVVRVCLALALAAVAAGFPIQDHRLFVQEALVGLTRPGSPCWLSGGVLSELTPVTDTLQGAPRQAFDFWARNLEKVYANVEVRAPGFLGPQVCRSAFTFCLLQRRNMSTVSRPGWTTCALCRITMPGTAPTGYADLVEHLAECLITNIFFSLFPAQHERLC